MAELSLEAAVVDTAAPPAYERIACKALHLRQLGLSLSAIVRRLGVTGKAVAKALAWLRHLPLAPQVGRNLPMSFSGERRLPDHVSDHRQ